MRGVPILNFSHRVSVFAEGKLGFMRCRNSFYRYGAAEVLLSLIRNVLGLKECEKAFTAAAPITQETLEYFGSIGIVLLGTC